MASAKSEAQRYLGREDDYINLAGLNKERNIANQVYNTNRTTFQNAYNDLLSTIASNRQKARTDFGSGRSTINENAYMRDRQNALDLSSRGLRGGLVELGKLGNRMETGRQYSNLANTFYNTMNELDATQRTGENEYNTNLEQAQNTLQAALADIGAREAAGRNQYRAQVAQLAEQIQARRDAAAAAAASLALQRQQSRQSGLDAIKKALSGKNWGEAVDYLVRDLGIAKDTKEAANWLRANTKIRAKQGEYSSPSGYSVRTPKSTPVSTSTSLVNTLNKYNYFTPSGLTSKLYSLLRR